MTPPTNPVLSVIVPCYNEALTISSTVPELYAYLSSLPWTFELIIGNDGSTDNTSAVGQELTKKYEGVRLAGYDTNRGKGAILSTCFAEARGTYQLFIDADLSIEKKLIKTVVDELSRGADIVIASKYLSSAQLSYPFPRLIMGKCFAWLTRALLKGNMKDYQCGLKGFRKDAIQRILQYVKETGFLWDTEVLAYAQLCNYAVVEIPVILYPDKGRISKVHPIRETKRMLISLIRLRRRLRNESVHGRY